MNDFETVIITFFVVTLMITVTFIDLYRFHRAFDKMREGLWRGLVPFTFCAAYQVVFVVLGYNIFSTIIFLYFLFSAMLALVVWNTEYFYGAIMRLPSLGPTTFQLHFNISTFKAVVNKTQSFQTNTYKFKDECTTFEQFTRVIDGPDYLTQIESQFKSKNDQARFKQWAIQYKEFKADAKRYRVTPLGYYNTSQIFRGYKKLIYIHETDAALELIEGNCIVLPGKIDIDKRPHEVIICLAGKKAPEISQNMQTSPVLLHVLSNLPTIQMYPALLAFKNKLQADNENLLEWMEQFKSQSNVAKEALDLDLPSRSKRKEAKDTDVFRLVKYLLCIIIVIAVALFAFMFLITFGVI